MLLYFPQSEPLQNQNALSPRLILNSEAISKQNRKPLPCRRFCEVWLARLAHQHESQLEKCNPADKFGCHPLAANFLQRFFYLIKLSIKCWCSKMKWSMVEISDRTVDIARENKPENHRLLFKEIPFFNQVGFKP